MLPPRQKPTMPTGPIALDRIDRSLGVAQHRGPVGIGDECARIGDFIRRVAALEIRLGAIEDRRRDRDIARGGDTVADRADVVIDAKDLLDHHDGALRARLRGSAR